MGQEPAAAGRTFQIHSCLGRGGFGEVYRATMTSSGGVQSEVAIKILREDIDPGSEAVKRLRDEGRLLGALRHPAILKVHDLVVLEGRVALVTEFVEGEDLDRCILAEPPIPARSLLSVVGEVAAALDAAWSTPSASGAPIRLVHRDIKPANIRIGKHGEVKLLDFGIARAANVAREAQTASNSMMGSFLYMAPERFHTEEVQPPSDVYALGCVLYEGLMRRRFFEGQTLKQIYATMLSQGKFETHREERFALLDSATPNAVMALLRDLLHVDPAFRPNATETASRCEDMVEYIAGPTLKRWSRKRVWPPQQMVSGSLDGRELTASTFVSQADVPRPSAPPSLPPVREVMALPSPGPAAIDAPPPRMAAVPPPIRDRASVPPAPAPTPLSSSAVAAAGAAPQGDVQTVPRQSVPDVGGVPMWQGAGSSTVRPMSATGPISVPPAPMSMAEPGAGTSKVPLSQQKTIPPEDPIDDDDLDDMAFPGASAYFEIREGETPPPIPGVLGTPIHVPRVDSFDDTLAYERSRRRRFWVRFGVAALVLAVAGGSALAYFSANEEQVRAQMNQTMQELQARVQTLGSSLNTDAPARAEMAPAEPAPTDPIPGTAAEEEPAEAPAAAPPEPVEPVPAPPEPVAPAPRVAPSKPAPAPQPVIRPRPRSMALRRADFRRDGWAAVERSEHSRAVELFERALELSSSDADAWYGKGYALMRQGRNGDAADSLCWAIQHGDSRLRTEVRSVMRSNELSCP